MEKQEVSSDEALMAAYQAGDNTAFDELVGRYARELFAFLFRFVGERTVAEDVVQEAFLQVHVSAGTFDPSQRFRPWLFTIAANKARDRLRRRARRPTASLDAPMEGGDESGSFLDLVVSNEPGPDADVLDDEMRNAVRTLVGGMPDHLREILILSYFHNFSYREVADILDVPVGTVKSRLHAAVAHFAQKWRRKGKDK